MERLQDRKSTLLYIAASKSLYLFKDNVAYDLDTNIRQSELVNLAPESETIALVDVDNLFKEPPVALKAYKIVLATSPRSVHWRGWQKSMRNVFRYVLPPFKLSELLQM